MDMLLATGPERMRSSPSLRARVSAFGFRLSVLYLGLFCLSTQIITSVFILPKVDVGDPATLWPARVLIQWVARHIFQISTPVEYTGSGSGDKTFDWVLVFCLLIVSVLAAGAWSLLDSRVSYTVLDRWFRLFLRYCLAGQMITYGLVKAVPLQMPFPYLFTQVEPFGNLSPMGILWASIGASPAYEVYAGCAELAGGLLLMFPRTATLGALLCLADMMEVFVLNMTYDVPVKILSFHLILLSLFLLAPHFRRLANFFFLDRAVDPVERTPYFDGRRANRIAFAVQVFLWIWILSNNVYNSVDAWYAYGGGRHKPDLYGIWDVEEAVVDGQIHPPLLTDATRWRRMIIDFGDSLQIQRMDDSRSGYGASFNPQAGNLVLTDASRKSSKGTFTCERPSAERVILSGSMDGHSLRLQLRRVDHTKFLFASRGFHWIQEYPFNR